MPEKFIVAIGSSAGAIEPLKVFFDHTPHDQATYVLLRHVPIEHQGAIQEVLSRHSKLEILEATDGDLIENDKVYTAPAAMYMTIKQNRFHLQPRILEKSVGNWSINIFLQTLAEDKGKNSVAVILSGGGEDGAKGAALVKQAGGLVIAQKPESCEHPEMPVNAIKAGCVDYILLPAEMPEAIFKYVHNKLKNSDMLKNWQETETKI